MESSEAKLGLHRPTSAAEPLFLHPGFKSTKSKQAAHTYTAGYLATSPLSDAETQDVSGLSRNSIDTFFSDASPGGSEGLPKVLSGLSPNSTATTVGDEDEEEEESEQLTKARALALQKELLQAFTSPSFQKRHAELVRSKATFLREELVQKQQAQLIGRYGFEESAKGVAAMRKALDALSDDSDILVNELAIQEALATDDTHSKPFELAAQPVKKPSTVLGMCDLLYSQMVSFSYAPFQHNIQKLQEEMDRRLGHPDPRGYYHLPGRAELALQVQKELLPMFGFEGTKAGVQEMIVHCAMFLDDPEVADLLDMVNAKLGMSPAACARFRQLARSLAPGK